ncbi:MAG: hypothetical protein KIB42_03285 [Varibaculum cambriense]|uniref:hypothetical protein n=1 Tax=Varibaculum cambriense TaxID=184870 RepID=UPI001ECE6319|nr:hypothetical protein [Varibaculum cambriense]MBS5918636.1 hypothetical protein [Varibaculum cambriense]
MVEIALLKGILSIMQTTRLFLQKINPKLASRVNEHSPGLVSDLVFNGFSERIVLLLPLATDHGETTWTALASKHNISVPSHCMTRKTFQNCGVEGIYYPEGEIPDREYASKLAAVLSNFSESSSWTGIFWVGYAEQQCRANTIGPEESSFLRPEPYSMIQLPTGQLGALLQEHLPSILFDDSVSCVVTQPIYGDRLYVSCEHTLATALASELGDIFPVSPTDPMPDYLPY